MNTRTIHPWVLAAAGVLFGGCSGGGAGDGSSGQEAVSAPGAVVLDAETTDDAKVFEDRIELPRLDPSTRARLKAGTVVIGRRGRTADNAQGFLRRVESVADNDDVVVVSTSTASMRDAISRCAFEKSSGLVDPYATGGADDKPTIRQQAHGGGKTFTHTFKPQTIYSDEHFEARLEPTTTQCSPSFDTALNMRGFRVEGLKFVMNDQMSISAELSLTARGRFAKNVSFPLFKNKIPLPPQQIGPIPLEETIDVSVDLSCDFSAEGSITASAGVKVDLGYQFGVEYANGEWTTVADADKPIFTPIPPSVHGNVSSTIDCRIVPRVALLFYDVVGPYISVTPRVVLNANASLDTRGDKPIAGEWSLTGSLRADAGLTGEITVPGAPQISNLLNDGIKKAQLQLFADEKKWNGAL